MDPAVFHYKIKLQIRCKGIFSLDLYKKCKVILCNIRQLSSKPLNFYLKLICLESRVS